MKQERRQIDLKNIRITDSLFGSQVKQVSEKIIPYQWKNLNDQLEGADKTYCIENFRIAAGELEGTRKGVVFQDTDLYKWLESVAYTIAGVHVGPFAETASPECMDPGVDRVEKKYYFYSRESGICRIYAAGGTVFSDIADTGNGIVSVICICSHRTWN